MGNAGKVNMHKHTARGAAAAVAVAKLSRNADGSVPARGSIHELTHRFYFTGECLLQDISAGLVSYMLMGGLPGDHVLHSISPSMYAQDNACFLMR